MDLSDLITEEIDDRFCYIQYDEFELIMMKSNGYINASKLCKLGGKRFADWHRLDGSKNLIEELENVNKIWKIDTKSHYADLRKVIIEVKTESKGKNQYKVAGSYVHQDLIPHICSWISSIFAIKVSKIINCFMSGKYEFKLKEKEDNILKLQNTLDNLKLQNNKFQEKYDNDVQELKDQNNDLKDQITKTSEEHKNDINELKSYYREQRKELKEEFKETKKELKEQTLQLKESIKDLENKLKIKAVINPNKIRKTHKLIILQHKINLINFKVLRIQKEREKVEINKYYNDYNIFYNQFEPNPISCFNYLKEHLKYMKYIKNDYNDIELIDLDNYNIDNFKQDLDNLNIVRCI